MLLAVAARRCETSRGPCSRECGARRARRADWCARRSRVRRPWWRCSCGRPRTGGRMLCVLGRCGRTSPAPRGACPSPRRRAAGVEEGCGARPARGRYRRTSPRTECRGACVWWDPTSASTFRDASKHGPTPRASKMSPMGTHVEWGATWRWGRSRAGAREVGECFTCVPCPQGAAEAASMKWTRGA